MSSRATYAEQPLSTFLVRREIRMLQRGCSHRQLAEAMGPDMVSAFDAELEALRCRRVLVVDGCPCLQDMHPEEPGWPDIACYGHCSACYRKQRVPPLRCECARSGRLAPQQILQQVRRPRAGACRACVLRAVWPNKGSQNVLSVRP